MSAHDTTAHDTSETVAFWEAHYGERDQIWSGRVNQRLADEVASLPPGDALDLGCGEGADAIWLAEHGWRVVAVDVSATALARAARAAAQREVPGPIDWQRHDLEGSFPVGTFDLVVAAYLLSPVPLDRTRIMRAAAAAVRPGGTLIILGHTDFPPGHEHRHDHDVRFATVEEEIAGLALDPAERWEVEVAEEFPRPVTAQDGRSHVRHDTVVRVRRG